MDALFCDCTDTDWNRIWTFLSEDYEILCISLHESDSQSVSWNSFKASYVNMAVVIYSEFF